MALTLKAVQRMIESAMAKAESLKINVSVAVVDVGGHCVAKVRMDGAAFLTIEIAEGKAYTCVAFRRSSEEFAQGLANQRPSFHASLAALTGGKLVATGGGLPIKEGDQVIGGIGVSGGTADQDVDCARAALAALG